MAHTYASVAEFNDWLRDAGSTTFATEDAKILARKLATLEGVSRRIEEFCDRSMFGSGFGPRLGTNRYDGDGRSLLWLKDDLLSLTSLSTRPYIGADATALVNETDFILEPHDTSPKRGVSGLNSTVFPQFSRTFPNSKRTVELVGKWGYTDTRRTATATASAIGTTTTTSVTVSSATEFSPGQTILIEAEQLYIRSMAAAVLTVVRGANGTTAATHGAASAIDIYEYPAQVLACQQDLAVMRWRRRDAGSDGMDGGGEMPTTGKPRGDELSALHAHLNGLRLILAP